MGTSESLDNPHIAYPPDVHWYKQAQTQHHIWKKRTKERKEALWIKVFFSDSYLCNYRMTSHAMKVSPVCEAAIPLGVCASILIGFLHTWPGKVFSSWGRDSTSPSPDGSSPFSHSVRHSSDTDDSGKWLFLKKSVLIHFFLFYNVCWVHHTTECKLQTLITKVT